MSKETESTNLTRETALKAYQACKTDEERAVLYHSQPVLREILSAVTHPKPVVKAAAKLVALVAVVACLLGGVARADSYVFLGSLVSVSNTTSNSAALAVGSFAVPQGRFFVSNGGLTATNALHVNVQVSVDGTNFVTVATYWPSSTNAVTDSFSPGYAAQTIYLRTQAVTTNAVSVGTTYQY